MRLGMEDGFRCQVGKHTLRSTFLLFFALHISLFLYSGYLLCPSLLAPHGSSGDNIVISYKSKIFLCIIIQN